MRPLIEITTTSNRYEYEVMRARLEITQQNPAVNRTTRRAQLNMRRQAGRLDMSTVRRRSDMGFKGVVDRANFEADRGRNALLEKIGDYAEFGNQLTKAYQGATIPDALWAQSMKHSKGDLVLVPVSPVDIHYIPASLTADYVPGELSANWNVGRARLDYVPGSFRLNFSQYAQVSFEYVGGFNYVPRAAAPGFVAQA